MGHCQRRLINYIIGIRVIDWPFEHVRLWARARLWTGMKHTSASQMLPSRKFVCIHTSVHWSNLPGRETHLPTRQRIRDWAPHHVKVVEVVTGVTDCDYTFWAMWTKPGPHLPGFGLEQSRVHLMVIVVSNDAPPPVHAYLMIDIMVWGELLHTVSRFMVFFNQLQRGDTNDQFAYFELELQLGLEMSSTYARLFCLQTVIPAFYFRYQKCLFCFKDLSRAVQRSQILEAP